MINLDKIKFLTFAKGSFVNIQQQKKEHLKNLDVTNIVNLTDNDLDFNFKLHHQELLKHKRGYGYWIWKPYIILKELQKMKTDEVLVYSDVSDMPTNNFIELLRHHFVCNYYLFANQGYCHGQWTKRDCFIEMGCDYIAYHKQIQLEAGLIALKNTDNNIKLIEEWYSYCNNLHLLTDAHSIASNLSNYKEHRHDQSILTNIALKRNLCSFHIGKDLMSFNAVQPKTYG